MSQLDIDFKPSSRDDVQRQIAFAMIDCHPDLFRAEFKGWLDQNWPIWRAFELEAIRVHDRGRKHYSANTIIEFLRHYTAMRDVAEDFKFNDRWTSSIARLYVLMHPNHMGLFEFRVRADGLVSKPEGATA